jgi:hypothetical protein
VPNKDTCCVCVGGGVGGHKTESLRAGVKSPAAPPSGHLGFVRVQPLTSFLHVGCPAVGVPADCVGHQHNPVTEKVTTTYVLDGGGCWKVQLGVLASSSKYGRYTYTRQPEVRVSAAAALAAACKWYAVRCQNHCT